MLRMDVVVFVVGLLCSGLFLEMSNSVLAQSDQLELQWSKTYDNCYCTSTFQTIDDGFLIAGANYTTFPAYLMLIKTGVDGEVEWCITYSGITWVPELMRVTDSGYLLLHDSLAVPGGGVDLLKVDLQGDFEWSKRLPLWRDSIFSEYVKDFFVDNDGRYVLFVEARPSRSGYGPRFRCYDVDGVLLWDKNIGHITISAGLLSEGGESYYVAGSQEGQLWFAKLNLDGEIVWSRTYKASKGSSWFNSIVLTGDGGFLLGGCDYYYDEGVDFVVKVDGEGRAQWRLRCDESVLDVVEISGGRYLMFGRSEVVCVGVSGKVLWFEPYFKYFEDSVSLANVTYLARGVVAFVGGDGGVVVAVPYGVAVGGGTSDLWVASFSVEPSVFAGGEEGWSWMLICGIVVAATVVMGGLIYYLKKKRRLHGRVG